MSMARITRALRIVAPYIPAFLLIAIFARQGWAKFDDTSGWAVAFRHWGYPTWFRVAVGIMELAACALLIWGRTAVLGAILIVAVMLGAWGTHIAFDHGRHMTSEVVPLTLAVVVLVLRRRQLRIGAAI
jgi:uncharacterized membrane protein YphA (DoxX/SURF4 family)